MTTTFRSVALAVFALVITACTQKVMDRIEITSSSFPRSASIPEKFALTDVSGGKNLSPQISWSTQRKDIQSFALLFYDKHPIARNWVHWCVTDIPATVASLAEGASPLTMPEGTHEYANTYGFTGYGGPNPPKGTGPHEYELVVVGLNTAKLDLGTACTRDSFMKATAGKAIAEGRYVGSFERT